MRPDRIRAASSRTPRPACRPGSKRHLLLGAECDTAQERVVECREFRRTTLGNRVDLRGRRSCSRCALPSPPPAATSNAETWCSPSSRRSILPPRGTHTREVAAAELLVREVDPLAVGRVTEIIDPAIELRRQHPWRAAGRGDHRELLDAVDAVLRGQIGDRATVGAPARQTLDRVVVGEPRELACSPSRALTIQRSVL